MIVTFYSFKGGVGRSMALANVAEILADHGYRVIVCDWDLEAPGLERYLSDDPQELARLRRSSGVVDLVRDYKQTLSNPAGTAAQLETQSSRETGFEQVGDIILRQPSDYTVEVRSESRKTHGWIRFLSAGLRTGDSAAAYNEGVRTADWSNFYEEWAGGAYFEFFRRDLDSAADLVLIDSRTGITEMGGICTHHLADMVLVFSGANEQNLEGTETMIQSLLRVDTAMRNGRKLCAAPVASRIDTLAETTLTGDFYQKFEKRFAAALPVELGPSRTFLENTRIPYAAIYSFGEKVVARQSGSERIPELYRPYLALANAIVRWGDLQGLIKKPDPSSPIAARRLLLAGSVAKSPTPTGRLRGEYVLAWADNDQSAAEKVASGLRTAGLNVWCTAVPGALRDNVSIAIQIDDAVDRSAGYLLLLPERPSRLWQEAELNLMLSKRARDPAYRTLIILPNQDCETTPELDRISQVALLPEWSPVMFEQIIGELRLALSFLGEEPSSGVLDRLGTPQEPESRFFAGRDRESRELLERIESRWGTPQPALVVTGEAGVGKSALIRTGLLPAFRRRSLVSPLSTWSVAVARWMPDTLGVGMVSVEVVGEQVANSAGESWERGRERIMSLPKPLLLVLEGVEELMTSSRERSLAQLRNFLNALGSNESQGLFVLWTIRSECLSELAQSLPEWVDANSAYRVMPPGMESIRSFLTTGTALMGLRWEPGLVDVIIRDAESVKPTPRTLGSLLRELFSQRAGDTLAGIAYIAVGGLEGIIVRNATPAFQTLDERLRESARRILKGLIDPQTLTLLPRSRTEVLAFAGGAATAKETLVFLLSQNLVVDAGNERFTLSTPKVFGLLQTSDLFRR